jgi:tubulin alpha
MITNSLGGGTGSGFGSLLTERLSVDFRKKTKFGVIVYPSSRLASSIVEPYNSTLASHSLFEHHDLTVTVDNQSLYGICDRSLGVESPNYHNINQMIASSISSLTSSMRFSGPLNTNMNEINTNLVPYPRIHFMCASHAPWSSEDSYQ